MRRIAKILVILCCLCTVTTVFSGGTTTQKSTINYLYVLTARTGTMSKTAKGYSLVLHQVSPQILWFTDRPNRKSGMIPTHGFIGHWHKLYQGDAPNIGLVHAGLASNTNGIATPMAMELSNPVVNGSSIRFKVKMLEGDRVKLGKLKDLAIFIDNGDGCGYGCSWGGPI